MECEISIRHGDIVWLKKDIYRPYWVAFHHSRCHNLEYDRFRKHIKDHTGFYLLSALQEGSYPFSDTSYNKCMGMLKRGMFAHIEIVGNIYHRGDFLKYKNLLI